MFDKLKAMFSRKKSEPPKAPYFSPQAPRHNTTTLRGDSRRVSPSMAASSDRNGYGNNNGVLDAVIISQMLNSSSHSDSCSSHSSGYDSGSSSSCDSGSSSSD